MEDIERELFEAWMRKEHPGVDLQRRVDGEYWSDVPDNFWEGWKGRAAIVPAIPTPEMVKAANRSCRNDEQCNNHWDHKTCSMCIAETEEDLLAALAAAIQPTKD